MLQLVLSLMLSYTQLTSPGNALPQILTPEYRMSAPLKAGQKGEVTVSFNILNGYLINHTPPMNVKLTAVPGITLETSDFTTPTKDPKSKDEYYVDLPTVKIPVGATKAGKYEIPGKLVYYFCSKADGFCSRQIVDMKVPVNVQ
jgi:hypothetical protein